MDPYTVAQVAQRRAWWKESNVYQIYPASFQDSNDDGIGDIPGIISKVDYLHTLGIQCVWLSPILKSPQVDMGYDVSDYRVIDARYGSIEDVDILIKELKSRGMKLLMDLVVNHTSDKHEWFQNSRSSKDSKYRDWYVWRPAKYSADGTRMPPNNWAAAFQGSAWEWDEATQEYYLHLFAVEQPDLNWENDEVRKEVHDIIRFWLNRGADGFRMDVINFISKEPGLPDAPVKDPDSEWQDGSMYYSAGPRLHEFLKDIGSILKEYDAFSVGEMPCVYDPNEIIKSVGQDRGELNMIFQFDHVNIDHGPRGVFSKAPKWPLSKLRTIFNTMETFMYAHSGWNALYLENHDQPRSISRFGNSDPKYSALSSKMLATFVGCLAGTPFIYQGQEIGMVNVPKEWPIDEYKDLNTLNHWTVLNSHHPTKEVLAETMGEYQKKARDNARTPMQWSSATHAGFTSPKSTPWMNAMPNHKTINAESQLSDPSSTFNYWRSMLAMRKKYKDIIVYGDFEVLDEKSESVISFLRTGEDGKEAILTLCNFSADTVVWKGNVNGLKAVAMSNQGRTLEDFNSGEVKLEAYEGLALLIESPGRKKTALP